MKKYVLFLLGILPFLLSAGNPETPGNQINKPVQTYHINFEFACGGDVLFTVSSPDYYYSDFVMTNPVSLDLPEGYYNLVTTVNTSGPTKKIYAILDRFHAYKDMDTTITQSSAVHLITTKINDEEGNAIPDQGYKKGNQTDLFFDFGPEYKMPVRWQNFPDWWQDSVYMTNIPTSMKVRIDRTTLVKKSLYHYYQIAYPALTSLTGDTLLSNEPSELLTFPQVFHNGPALTYYYAWGHGFVFNKSLGGTLPTMITFSLNAASPGKREDTVMLHATPISGDSVLAWSAVSIIHIKGSISNDDYLLSPITFVNEDQSLVLSENGYPFCPADCRILPGEYSDFGSSPPVNVIKSLNTPSSSYLEFFSDFKGYNNEARYIDQAVSTIQIWFGNQLILYDTLQGNYINYSLPSTGFYTVILNDSNYTLYGRQGYLKSALGINLEDPEDPDPPTPVSFKVLQGDVVSTEIVRGFPASVSFTAGDYYINDMLERIYQPLQSVSLLYKTYEDNQWQPLDVIADTAQFDSLSGMPYLADLAPAMALTADSVWVDLRLELYDPHGNLMIQEIHPAFLLRDVQTGTGNQDLSRGGIYPNPVEKNIFFRDLYKDDLYRIYDLQGKELLNGRCAAPADLSGLLPGVYLVRIIDINGSVVSTEKVIKL